MDELFLLPSAPVAMPRAYWGDDHHALSSAMLLVEPSHFEFSRIIDAIKHRENDDFDMEIVNHLYGDSCLVLPHRNYLLLTGDFRRKKHVRYLGSDLEKWNATAEYEKTKFIHFSDWPLPKPWITPEYYQRIQVEPRCSPSVEDDCSGAKIWFKLYEDFKLRRLDVCGEALNRPVGHGFG